MTPSPLSRPALSRRHLLALFGATGAAATLHPRPAAAAPAIEKSLKVGTGLYELAVSTKTGLVHVAAVGARGANDAKILGLDPQTLETRATIALGEDAAFGLTANDRRGLLLATGTRSGAFKIIDPTTGTIRARVTQGEGSHLRQVVADEAQDRGFATSFGARDRPSSIWVVDTAAGQLTTVITEGLEGGITGLAFDAANNRLFATALMSNEIVEVSLARNAGVRRFPSGGDSAVNVAFDPRSGRLFCTNQRSGNMAVLNAASGEIVKVIETGAGALGVTLSPDGGLCYVANRGAGTTSVIETRGLTVVANLPTGTHPNTVAIDPRSGLAYVSNKARGLPRGAPRDQAPPEDPQGDTVSIIRA